MKFTQLPLKDAYLIELEPAYDDRGYFARTYCSKEFAARGLVSDFVQTSISYNLKRGLIRGLHYQESPFAETKLIRCTHGSVFDVIVDLRPDSSTFKKSFSLELTENNHKMLYVPKHFAHGFQVLKDESMLIYMMDTYYQPSAAREISPFSNDFELPNWPIDRV